MMIAFLIRWLIFLALNGMVGTIAVIGSFWERQGVVRLNTFSVRFITLFLSVIIGVELALGLVGGLTLGNLLLCLGLLLSVFGAVAWKADKLSHIIDFDWLSSWRTSKALIFKNRTMKLSIFFGAWLALGIVIAVLAEPARMVDSLTYHLPMPVNWLKSSRITPFYLPFSDISNSYFPGNGELLYLWVMAPFRNDLLVRLVNVGLWGGGILILYCLNRKLDVPPLISLGAALIFGFTPLVLSQATELWLDMTAVTVFLLALVHLFDFARSLRTYDLGMFALSSGVFLGIKYSGLAYLLLLLLAWGIIVIWRRREYTWVRFLFHGLLVAVGVGYLGGYWFLRNFFLTGNPLFPLKVSILHHSLFPGMNDSVSYSYVTLGKQLNLVTVIKVVQAWLLGYGGVFLILCLPVVNYIVGYLLGLLDRFWTERRLRFTLHDVQRGLLIFLGLGSLVLYLRTPYSVMRFDPDTTITPQNLLSGARFGLTISALCVPFIAAVWQRSSWHHFFMLSLPVSLAQVLFFGYHLSPYSFVIFSRPFSLSRLLAAFFILLALLGMGFLLQQFRQVRLKIKPLVVIVAVGLVLAGMGAYSVLQYRERYRFSVYRREYGIKADGWRWIAENVIEARIAYTGGLPLNFPFYGSELSNDVRYINIAGGLDDRFHNFWKEGIYWRDGDYETWWNNIIAWEVDYLVIGSDSVIEATWVFDHPEHFSLAFVNDQIQIYRVNHW
jgi:intracellular septation protein A